MVFRIILKSGNNVLFKSIILLVTAAFSLSLGSCTTTSSRFYTRDSFENDVEDPNELTYTEFVTKKDSTISLNESDNAKFLKSYNGEKNIFLINKIDTLFKINGGKKQAYKLVKNLTYLKFEDVKKITAEKKVLNIWATALVVTGYLILTSMLWFVLTFDFSLR